jgi:hypothetical protein
LSTDDLSTDLTTDLAIDPFSSYVSDHDDDSALSDGGGDSVRSSTEVSPSGLSSSDSTKVSPLVSPSADSAPSKHTSKVFQAPWVSGSGEAGNFVEIATRGGIMEYDPILKQRKLVFYAL